MSATVRALTGYPWRHNSSANFAVLLDDQRNGDMGSPRVAGSTSRSNSFTSRGSCSAFDFLPPPAFRTRSGGTSLPSSSRTALCSVVRLNPVARANVAIPPWPRNRASAAATNRRCRSFRYGFRRACFAPNPESSAMTVSYILPAKMSSLFLPGYSPSAWAFSRASKKRRRNRRLSTRTGRKKPGRQAVHWPSGESPPPGTTQCKRGSGMQHGEEADFRAQVVGAAGDAEQGSGDGAEQDVIDDFFVVEGDGGNLFRQREDHVEVGHRQQLGGAAVLDGPHQAPLMQGKGCACR